MCGPWEGGGWGGGGARGVILLISKVTFSTCNISKEGDLDPWTPLDPCILWEALITIVDWAEVIV